MKVLYFGGLLVALAGTAATLQTIVLMNQLVKGQDEKGGQNLVSFSVPTVKTKEEPPKSPPPPSRPRPRSNDKALAPAPGVGSGLSSLTIDVPDYASANLDQGGQGLLGQVEDVAMTGDTVDRAPTVRQGALAYPDRAKQRGQEGRVTVSLLIGSDGRVEKLKILDSTPPGVFDQAVLDAVPGWVFVPAEYQGRPVPVWVSLPLDFKLK